MSCQEQPKLDNCEFICTLIVIFPSYFLIVYHTYSNLSMPLNAFWFTSVLHFFLIFPLLAITETKKALFLIDAIFSDRLHLG